MVGRRVSVASVGGYSEAHAIADTVVVTFGHNGWLVLLEFVYHAGEPEYFFLSLYDLMKVCVRVFQNGEVYLHCEFPRWGEVYCHWFSCHWLVGCWLWLHSAAVGGVMFAAVMVGWLVHVFSG